MSALLRSAKFLRFFSGVARNCTAGSSRTDADNLVNSQKQLVQRIDLRSFSVQHAAVSVGQLDSSAAAAAGGNTSSSSSLDDVLRRVDLSARRSGRIRNIEFNELMLEVKNAGTITSYQGLLLLRCCGSLAVEELPEKRTQLVLNIWDTLTTMGVDLDVSHYNALLRVYLENEHEFSPSSFLSLMRSDGVEPNRVTYQRLIYRYCMLGDIDGATHILGHMKENDMAINEHVFNSLIIGHARAKDIESAESMITMMRRTSLEPSPETYRHLACAHVECGRPENVWNVLRMAQDNDTQLTALDLLEIVYCLAVNGHSHTEHVDKLVHTVGEMSLFNGDTSLLVMRLISSGHDPVAYRVFGLMKPLPPQHSQQPAFGTDSGSFFIRHLVRVKRPADVVLSYCDRLRTEHNNPRALLVAVRAALMSPINPPLALSLLAELPQHGFQLRPHYFWPLLANCGTDVGSLASVLHRMTSLGCLIDSDTFIDQVFTQVPPSSFHHLLTELNNVGISYWRVAPVLCRYHLTNNDVVSAFEVMRRYKATYKDRLLMVPLIGYCRDNTMDVPTVVSVLRVLCDHSSHGDHSTGDTDDTSVTDSGTFPVSMSSRQVASDFLVKLVRVSRSPPEQLQQLVECMLSHGVAVTGECVSTVQTQLSQSAAGCSHQLSQQLEQLSSEQLHLSPLSLNYDMSTSFSTSTQPAPRRRRPIEDRLSELEQKLGAGRAAHHDISNLLIKQLSLLVDAGHLEKAGDVRKELETLHSSHLLPVDVLRTFCEHSAACGLLDDTRALFDKWTELHPESVDDACVLKAARLLFVNGVSIDGVISLLENCPRDQREPSERNGAAGRRGEAGGEQGAYFRSVWSLLNAVCETGRADNVQTVLDTLTKHHYITDTPLPLLAMLVKAHLSSGDLSACVSELKQLAKKYNNIPARNQVIKALITAENPDLLQEVIDLSTEVIGEVDTLYELALCFIECGKSRQASKILQTPGFRMRVNRLESTCNRYLSNNQLDELEGVLAATRHSFGVDRLQLYELLLTGYCRMNDAHAGQRLLSVWTRLQDDGLVATESMLRQLAARLTQLNIDVPFAVPAAITSRHTSTQQRQQATRAASSTVSSRANFDEEHMRSPTWIDWKDAIKSGNTEKALESRKILLQDGVKPSVRDMTQLVNQLVNNDQLSAAGQLVVDMLHNGTFPLVRVFKTLMSRLSAGGHVDILSQIRPLLNNDLLSTLSFDNRLCVAHLNAGTGVQYLHHLQSVCDRLVAGTTEAPSSGDFVVPLAGVLQMLNSMSDHRQQLSELCERFAQHGKTGPVNMLWVHHVLNNNYDTASTLFSSYLTDTAPIQFQPIIETGDPVKLRYLFDTLQTAPSVSDSARAVVVSSFIKSTATTYPSAAVEVFDASGLSPELLRPSILALLNNARQRKE